jgi:Permuted papain-like amidase enzyme, YaeF/YiiX, C92 family
MRWMFDIVGRLIARVQKPANRDEPLTANDIALRDTLRPGDVLLVEGKTGISGGIRYLTQSTWSHAALYVGLIAGVATDGEPHVLVEANIDEGVVSVPLSKYRHCQTRICRPMGLSEADSEKVCRYALERIGLGYDFKNVVDLMRHLLPVPQRWRSRTVALGSGDASRIICSSLIAQAFDSVRYPILPKITYIESHTGPCEIAQARHPSLYAPRDFDISPYFMVVKPSWRAASTTKTCSGPIFCRVKPHKARLLERSKRSQNWPSPDFSDEAPSCTTLTPDLDRPQI